MSEKTIELVPLFELFLKKSKIWEPNQVLDNTQVIGQVVMKQIEEKYSDEKYRVDRNIVSSYFDSIEKFRKLDLPFSLEHYAQITTLAKNKIQPYPHYSGIKVSISDLPPLK